MKYSPRNPNCLAYHCCDTCDRVDPLTANGVSVLALLHNETHGYDKVFPHNMGVYPEKIEGKWEEK